MASAFAFLAASPAQKARGRRRLTGRAELRDHQRELQQFHLRLLAAGILVLLLFALLAGRLVWLQVLEYAHYHTLAENNRISIMPVAPSRGIVLDRSGVVLAHNYSAYTLEIVPDRVQGLDATIDALAEVVEVSAKDRKRFRKLLDESRNFESLPIRTRLNDEEVARFAANAYRFPGVELKARLFRHYPQGELLSHVVGYIGRISEKELDYLEETGEIANYRGTDHIGKTGLEDSYERELHGETGLEQVETDAGGRAVRVLARSAPVTGNNLVLHLDSKLQKVAYDALGDYRGAVVAIDPRTGGVLAFVSKPGFDPNLFVDGIDTQNWNALNSHPDHPLNNRALRGVYPPGSTFKPFMALAALASGKRTPSHAISDPGFFSLPSSSHRYRDWKVGGHGTVDLHKSIVISCDTYYYGVGNDLGIDLIHGFVSQFGLGSLTGIDLDGEVPGILPSQQWKQRRWRQKWFAGDTISVSIGQGYVVATPLQLAHAISIIAADGTVRRPQVVSRIEDSTGNPVRELEPEQVRQLSLKPEHLELVKRALVDVTKPGGTAARAAMGAEYDFAGKTGTAQVVGMKQNEKYDEKRVHERHRDHALFIAYAPAEDPRIALAVLVENGGHGGSTAAPIARQVFDYYLLGKVPEGLLQGEADEDEHD